MDPTLRALKLWPHQWEAVEVCEKFFAALTGRSALVHMPTGTGKTGIMAVVSAMRSPDRPVLIVCPSAALVTQLTIEITGKFWNTIGADTKWAPDVALHLLPHTAEHIVEQLKSSKGRRVVVFSTIQSLQQLYKRPAYEELRGKFGTVLFDEGHREPAPRWARAARDLGAQTVLFSATPFRNDLKMFDVDPGHINFLSFRRAVDQKLIRGVEIVERPLGESVAAFAQSAIAARDAFVRRGRFGAQCKMIVRAADAEAVDELFDAFKRALRGRGESVLAVHDSFALETVGLHTRAPGVPTELYKRRETFLIHQFMLTEGIDDPNCTMLAIYEPFSTDRQLVQQVGRLLRHDGKLGTPIQPAAVLCQPEHNVAKMWQRFLAFDETCVRNDNRPSIRNDGALLKRLVEALADSDYISGKFRERLDLETVSFEDELRLPRSAVVFDLQPKFSLAKFKAEITTALREDDRFEQAVIEVTAGSCFAHISLRLRQSPYLAESLFLTPSLEVTIYAKHGSRLFFYDSAGLWLDNTDTRDRVPATSLRPLLPDDKETRVTSITLKNTDLGPLSIKSRSMTANSLAAAGTFMGEHLHVVTNVGGRAKRRRRSIGFVRSRVRDGEGALLTVEDFHSWTKSVAKEMRTASAPTGIFGRYALPIATPKDTTPINILIDLDELAEDFVDEHGRTLEFDFESLCTYIECDTSGPKGFDHKFVVVTSKRKSWPVWIRWDAQRGKYWLKSEELSRCKLKENSRISLTRCLNQRQPFRIIIGDSSSVYAYGGFYGIDLDMSRPGGLGSLLLNLVTGDQALRGVTSEKGDLTSRSQTWPEESLFGVIDRALMPKASTPLFGSPFDQLVCDDLRPEVADFIGVDLKPAGRSPRVVFIAAKWHEGAPGVGASNAYDVCAQVVRNLAYLKVDSQEIPGLPQRWNGDWSLNGGLVKRIRAGKSAAEIRGAIIRTRQNPLADRAFWLVLGGGILSRQALVSELAKPVPLAHVLQFAHLILSTYSSCQSVGVDMRIYCAD